VLCVDDERDILDAMKGLLTRWGCRVHLAHSASEAKAIFEHHSPAILLVDFQLSDGQTGFELVDFLHAHGQSGFVAALVSASPSAEVREGARRRGMDCLAKPINASALRALLTRLQEARTRG